jgi:hypothetical protein
MKRQCDDTCDERRDLHYEGIHVLSDARRNALHGHWAVLSYVEEMHTRWHAVCVEALQALESRWFEGVHDEGLRPGAMAAEEVSRSLRPHGIFVTATHPSMEDEWPWELSALARHTHGRD